MQHKRNWVQTLCILYIIIWTIAPPLGIDMIYRLLALGCVGIWFIFASARRFYIQRIHIQVALFVMLVILVAIVEHGDFDGVINQIALYILAVCFFMNTFYEDGSWDELRGIIPIVLILLAVFNHRTAEILAEDSSIARRLVRADTDTYDYLRQGIGGYGLIYPQVCVFPAAVMWIKSALKKNVFCFGIGVIWLITFLQCVFNSGYSIAIVVTILGTIMLFYRRRNVSGAVLVSAVLIVGVVSAILYNEGFRELLLQFFDGTEVANKINDIVSTGESGVAEDSIYVRIDAYWDSLNVALQYPIIGSLWNASSGGGHSAILDVLAKYGIWGCYIFCMIIFFVPVSYKKKYRVNSICRISNAEIIVIIYLAVLNSFPYNYMGMLMLMLPLIYEDIIKWEKIE